MAKRTAFVGGTGSIEFGLILANLCERQVKRITGGFDLGVRRADAAMRAGRARAQAEPLSARRHGDAE